MHSHQPMPTSKLKSSSTQELNSACPETSKGVSQESGGAKKRPEIRIRSWRLGFVEFEPLAGASHLQPTWVRTKKRSRKQERRSREPLQFGGTPWKNVYIYIYTYIMYKYTYIDLENPEWRISAFRRNYINFSCVHQKNTVFFKKRLGDNGFGKKRLCIAKKRFCIGGKNASASLHDDLP